MEIHELRALPEGLVRLRETSEREGFRMLARLEARWRSGENRFDGRGEGLFAVRERDRLLGVAGACRDPYLADPRVGRVRHVYVDPGDRRRGVGRLLLEAVAARGAGGFERLRLRADSDEAHRFYLAVGFARTSEPDATHVLEGEALARVRREG